MLKRTSRRARHRTLDVVTADAPVQFLGSTGVQGRAVVQALGAEPPIPGDVLGLVPVPAQVRDVPAAEPGEDVIRGLIHDCKTSLLVAARIDT